MKPIKYVLYPPSAPGLPWLAVVLKGDKPIDVFGSPARQSAERVLAEMQARIDAKTGRAYA